MTFKYAALLVLVAFAATCESSPFGGFFVPPVIRNFTQEVKHTGERIVHEVRNVLTGRRDEGALDTGVKKSTDTLVITDDSPPVAVPPVASAPGSFEDLSTTTIDYREIIGTAHRCAPDQTFIAGACRDAD